MDNHQEVGLPEVLRPGAISLIKGPRCNLCHRLVTAVISKAFLFHQSKALFIVSDAGFEDRLMDKERDRSFKNNISLDVEQCDLCFSHVTHTHTHTVFSRVR